MSQSNLDRLRSIKTLPSLVAYLRDELDWPLESDDIEDTSFDYTSAELGIAADAVVRIKEIKQLRSRPLRWGGVSHRDRRRTLREKYIRPRRRSARPVRQVSETGAGDLP